LVSTLSVAYAEWAVVLTVCGRFCDKPFEDARMADRCETRDVKPWFHVKIKLF